MSRTQTLVLDQTHDLWLLHLINNLLLNKNHLFFTDKITVHSTLCKAKVNHSLLVSQYIQTQHQETLKVFSTNVKHTWMDVPLDGARSNVCHFDHNLFDALPYDRLSITYFIHMKPLIMQDPKRLHAITHAINYLITLYQTYL